MHSTLSNGFMCGHVSTGAILFVLTYLYKHEANKIVLKRYLNFQGQVFDSYNKRALASSSNSLQRANEK